MGWLVGIHVRPYELLLLLYRSRHETVRFYKYIMAISKHQHDLQKQMFESFKKFSDIYQSKVELTGEKIRKVSPFDLPIDPSQSIIYKETNEVSIKMPQDEYERFLLNWGQYIDIMYVSQDNKMIREEFHKLHMLVQLLK